MPTKAVVATAYSWTGFYIGVHGGGGWNRFTGTDPTIPGDPGSSVNGSGAVAGGQIGGNYQIGNVVLGVEGTLPGRTSRSATAGLSQAAPASRPRSRTIISRRLRDAVGYAFDRVLVYGKGGAAFTRDRLDANNGLPGALAGSATGSFDRTGWLAGVGVEWAFLQNWSVKAEYNYMGFGSITEVPTNSTPSATSRLSPAGVKLDLQTAVTGIDYKF